MRFLIILLILIVLYKLVSRIYQFITRINEPFGGNCILPGFIPTFKDSELNYENIKAKYIENSDTNDISVPLLSYQRQDLKKALEIYDEIAKDPLSEDYAYLDKINCKRDYLF